jgi:hypothetical protein
MIGSTIIHTKEIETLLKIGIEFLLTDDSLTKVELDELLTLDFAEMTLAADLDWAEGDPIFLDEDEGVAVFKINPLALDYVICYNKELSNSKKRDIGKLKRFVLKNGNENLYEISIF